MQPTSGVRGDAHTHARTRVEPAEEDRRMKVMERRYVCSNGVIERTRFVVGDNTQIRRGRRKATSERKQEQNDKSAIRRLARALNCNIREGDGSLLISLDYSEAEMERMVGGLDDDQRAAVASMREPKTWKKKREAPDEKLLEGMAALVAAAEKKLSAWLRKLRKLMTVRFASVTSYTDGETGELVRLHHHVVLMGCGEISLDKMVATWSFGGIDIKRVRSQRDYTPIAVYLLRQAKRTKKDGKLYRISRGLEMPMVEEREVTGSSAMRIPAQAVLFEQTAYDAAQGPMQGQYARYVLCKTKKQQITGMTVEGGGDHAV